MTQTRRGFSNAFDAGERDAAQVFCLMSYLYQVEKSLRSQQAGPALREARRASHSAPHLRLIKEYLQRILSRHLSSSLMGKAISYALNHGPANAPPRRLSKSVATSPANRAKLKRSKILPHRTRAKKEAASPTLTFWERTLVEIFK